MNKPEQDDFTVSFDAGEQEGAYVGEALEKKVDSLGWRVTLLTVIVPCLIAVVVVMAYFGITRKVADVKATGTAAVKNIAQTYDQQLTRLADAQDTLQNDLDQMRADLEKNLATVEKKTGADIRSVQNRLDTAAGTVTSLKQAVDKLDGRVTELSGKLASLTTSAEKLRGDLDGLAAEVQKIKSTTADQAAVDRQLADLKKEMQAAVRKAVDQPEARIVALSNKVEALEKRLVTLEKEQAATAAEPVVSPPLPPPDTGEESGIVEEDLSR